MNVSTQGLTERQYQRQLHKSMQSKLVAAGKFLLNACLALSLVSVLTYVAYDFISGLLR